MGEDMSTPPSGIVARLQADQTFITDYPNFLNTYGVELGYLDTAWATYAGSANMASSVIDAARQTLLDTAGALRDTMDSVDPSEVGAAEVVRGIINEVLSGA
jgi:hypothetical protein